MAVIESSRRVLHWHREQHERGDEETERNVPPASLVSAEQRREMIAEAAYFRAQGRNFEPGREVEDWIAAEAQIDEVLAAEA
jgi:hypothetical protein